MRNNILKRSAIWVAVSYIFINIVSCKSLEIFTLIETDLVIPIYKEYDYKIKFTSPTFPGAIQSVAGTKKLSGQVAAIPSGIQVVFNYQLSPYLSFGPVLGFQKFKYPDLAIVKVGMMSRLYFVDKDSFFIFAQGGFDLPADRSQFEIGGNVRLGIGYPVWKKDMVNMNLSIFYDRHFVNIKNTPAQFIIDFPQSYRLQNIGLGFSIHFLGRKGKKKTYYKHLPENRKL